MRQLDGRGVDAAHGMFDTTRNDRVPGDLAIVAIGGSDALLRKEAAAAAAVLLRGMA